MVMELAPNLATNDVAQVAGTLTCGGTLVLTNLSGNYAAGQSFKLFNATSYQGAFTNIVPAIPAINLAWSTNNLSNGILDIVSKPTALPSFGNAVAGGNSVIFSGAGGVPNWTYYILASTNVALPFDQWQPVATNTFDQNGNFNLTNSVDPAGPQTFYLLQMP